MKKRILAMLLTIVMLIGTLPMNAFATEASEITETVTEEKVFAEVTEPAEETTEATEAVIETTEETTEAAETATEAAEETTEATEEATEAAAADQAAAQTVIDLITAIGEVTLESEAAIAAADAAYNNLTDAQKVLVTNLDVLETAKSTYSALAVPAPVEAAADAVVYVTVNNKGVLAQANDGSVMVNKSVTVTDINADGVLSYDEALVAAHAAYNSADGYVTEGYEDSGKSVTKLWGVDNGFNYLFFINGNPITMNVAETSVVAGNSLYISVLSEMTYGADWYTYFDKTNLTVKAGEEFTLILKGYQGRSENPAATAVSGAAVGTWQSGSFSSIEGKTTDESGAVTLSFDQAGTYYVTASGTVSDTVYGMTVECPTMAPVCVVTVETVEVPVESITLNKTELSLCVGNSNTLKAAVLPEGNAVAVTWSSSDEKIATVENGKITAVAVGEVTITATAGGKTAECKVTVTEPPRLGELRVSKEWSDSGNYYTLTPAFNPLVTTYTLAVPDYAPTVFPYAKLAEGTEGKGLCYYSFNSMFGGFVWTSGNNVNVSGGYFGVVIYDKANSMSTEDIRYTVNFGKVATLKTLTVDGVGSLAFNRDTNSGYHYYVDSTQDGVDITATGYKSNYTVTIGGNTVTNGEAYRLAYNWDENGKMEVPVTVSGENVAENTYTLVLEKQPLNDAPFILVQPVDADYTVISTVTDLSVKASANGELAYQWYYNTTDSTENGTLIEGATMATYTPPITENVIGTRYYYCVITNTGKTEGNVSVSSTACVTVDPDPTPIATITNPGEALTGYDWATGYVYTTGAEATPLAVTATAKAEGGTFSYRWYRVSVPYGVSSGSSPGGSAITETYTPPTTLNRADDTGRYYACKVTYTFKNKSYSAWATTGSTYTDTDGKSYDVNGVFVYLTVDSAAVPTISTQPVSASYMTGDTAKALSVRASRADGGTLTYQWYVNDTDSTEGGTPIEGATSNSYSLGTFAEASTKYYYCVVTNTIQGYTATVTSSVAKIEVSSTEALIGQYLTGSGTQENPFLIENAQDYQDVYDLVAQGTSFSGFYLKQVNDITLPEGWQPIGSSTALRFSGNLNGNGKTLSVPAGGLPLLGHVQGAAVTNMNIYGTQIAGYGLVNNFVGLGLSGIGIVIDNVTLKSGSSTLKSGLIGTYITTNGFAGCSAGFVAEIRNCTIEEDVVIGYDKSQSMIGSIAGRINGTIENCKSYATVYGTSYVGGILGTRDNAMGGCVVTNSQFHGTVVATGEHAGGIVGGGYSNSTAPNGAKVNINGCSATDSVTGADKVGGVIGGDTYVVQLWGGHTLQNNSFTGTVSATDGTYVGGIIGFYNSLNVHDGISGNYYAAGCGADKGIGFVQYVDTNCADHETASGATYVNTADGESGVGGMTKTGLNRTDDPLGADAANLAYTDAGAEPVDVTVTVSNKGALALVNGTVTVKDTNADGILTYHEALEAAHAAYCEGGYTATESEWGISISEIWGVETYNSLYFRNGAALTDHVGNTETSTVAEGDYLVVSVNKDDTYYADRYSSFNVSNKIAVVGSTFTLTLKADISSGSAVVSNATIGTWSDGVFTPLEGMTTDESGKVKLSFAEVGTYIVSASGTVSDIVQDWSNGGAEVTADCPIIAPVCVVKIVDVPYFSDLDLYKSSSDYTNGAEPLEMTPAFVGTVYDGYSVKIPDYLNSVYAVGTLSEETLNSGWTGYVMFSNSWGGWTGGTVSNGVAKRSANFAKGYVSIYLGSSANGEYKVNVGQYATLKGLTIDGVWDTAFNRDTNAYHVYVDGTVDGITITPAAYKDGYTIKINGTEVTGGEGYTLPYSWDESGKMAVTIEVSGTNVTASTYTVNLEKQPLNDAPFIMTQPVAADYTIIDTKVADLFVEASANGDMTYQWYWSTTDSNENGTLINGATASSYTPPITEDVIGTRYYYCVITNTSKTEGNVTTSNTARVTVDPDPTPKAVIIDPGEAMPEDYEYAWDTGYVYAVGDEATALTVTATSDAEGGEFSYQWRKVSRPYNNNGWSSVSGDSTSTSYIPSTELKNANDSGAYYGCEVTYTFKGKIYKVWANTGATYTEKIDDGIDGKTYDVMGVYVFIKVDGAAVPEITAQPSSNSYMVGDAMNSVSVSATRADGGKLTYQWYENTTNSTDGGTAIEGATKYYYSLGTASEGGTKYYYCVVSNTIQGHTSTVTSEIAQITVETVEDVLDGRLKGSGTQEDPYLIENAQDYQDVYNLVAEGMSFQDTYLKQTADITLNDGWKSIGVLIDPSVGHINSGKNMNAFSGVLDGGGYTVTVPEGGLPLLGYVKGATVKNLNIYGKKIAGYGLVNHLEGVGLSGEAICIDNVTLKSGSSTLKSGLIGTYITNNGFAGCSAAFYVTIKNCTIEEGVVIGYNKDQSMIGSIAGRIHGTIDNCVSYATVYGKDYVGGILGTRDNAMGGCVVTNSQFHGTVTATGTQVGGIVGGGYCNSTAPNGAKININNCSVSGSVTGADKVGGIVGSDSFVAQLWGGHSLKNNSFTGTVKATDGTYVGGIIGYYLSLNKYDDISGNYYKAGCGADRGIGFVEYVDTSCETHETEIGGTYFNTGDGTDECPTVAGCSWKKEHNRIDDPLGADAAKLCYTDSTPVTATEMKISGTYKTTYTTGEKLDLSGIVLTVVYNDKSEKTIKLSDATVTGYDANKVGEQELTISYNGLTALITVKVENPKGEIKVTVTVYGDSKHGDNGSVHTLAGGGLTTWVSATTYTVDSNSTVWDVLQKAFADNGITCNAGSNNSQGTVYISALTRNGVTLAEFDNGTNSGWMYTLNGSHSDNGVAQQYLKDGDKIVFHYTDDYTKEQGSEGNDEEEKDAKAAEAAQKLIDAIGTVTLNSADEIEAAREAYDNLTYAQKQLVDNYATLTAAESKYAQLKAADDEKKADAVEDLIDAIKEGSTTFEDDVKAAQKAYNVLTADQKKLVDNYAKLANALKELADEEDKEAAEAVEKLIKDLGTITLDSEDDIKAAREAYDKLTDEQKALVENLADLEAAEEKLAQLRADAVTEDIYKTTGDYIENLGTPVPGSIGGEWMVIGLIRSDREVPGADDYYASVVKYVQENIDENERLHRAKSSDNSRIILALTAMGKDVTSVGGHNLLNGLNDIAFVQKQGINGPIWALIAFDSGNYPTPEGDVTREALIQIILDAQLADGGWALSGEVSDADMTGMAVQALAPYYERNADVKKALDEAMETLSKMQAADGSYGSIDGTSSESIAQVIVALAALGIDADKDERFVKNGISAVDALCAFYVEGGGFKHLMDGKLDGMATEQGYYALTAYFRMLDDKTSLYYMTDVMDMGGDVEAVEPTETLPAETEPAPTEPVQVEDEDKGNFPWWIIIALLIAGAVVVVIVNRKKIFASVR